MFGPTRKMKRQPEKRLRSQAIGAQTIMNYFPKERFNGKVTRALQCLPFAHACQPLRTSKSRSVSLS